MKWLDRTYCESYLLTDIPDLLIRLYKNSDKQLLHMFYKHSCLCQQYIPLTDFELAKKEAELLSFEIINKLYYMTKSFKQKFKLRKV